MEIRKLETIDEMMKMLPIIHELTAGVTPEDYRKMLLEMIPHNYYQVAAFEGDECLGVSGYWIATKIYCGKYVEIDNLVIKKEHRSKNVGKALIDWILDEGRKRNCQTALLDAYVENFKAHRFYYREGFIARGFHYLKKL